jgi:Ala-tRNA(Pro) deacylase
MPIAPTLMRYLDQNATYDIVLHEPTVSSMRTAQACHIPGDCLAKGVVLRRDGGSYLLAVLPASHHISLPELRMELGEDVDMASESNIDGIFFDCAHGAVPPVGECYGLDVVVDEALDRQPDIYFEGGDHMTLVHMSQSQFARLTANARHQRFSLHA